MILSCERSHIVPLSPALRATSMGDSGEWNVGQLARERFGEDVVLVGFSTYTGSVTAASDRDGPAEQKRVRPALPGSFEALFHAVGTSDFLLNLRRDRSLARAMFDSGWEIGEAAETFPTGL